MNRSPYGNSPEDALLYDRNWQAEYRELQSELEGWVRHARALESKLAKAEDQLVASADLDTCSVPGCTTRRAEYARIPLCDIHCVLAWTDQRRAWEHAVTYNPGAVPVEIREQLVGGARPWVVYYIRFGENVKIGRTTNLVRRMRAFCSVHDQLLAVEPGVVVDGLDRETQRHREFAELRIPGTELFVPNDALREHIATVVATFGDPQQYLTPEAA